MYTPVYTPREAIPPWYIQSIPTLGETSAQTAPHSLGEKRDNSAQTAPHSLGEGRDNSAQTAPLSPVRDGHNEARLIGRLWENR